ncbi:MAG: regulatory protein SipA [Stenomitos frigidus ULC029]
MSQTISVGDRVRLVALPAFIKTADPMPMLRPPTVLAIGAEGLVINQRPGNYWSVRFANGTFLVEPQYLQTIELE